MDIIFYKNNSILKFLFLAFIIILCTNSFFTMGKNLGEFIYSITH